MWADIIGVPNVLPYSLIARIVSTAICCGAGRPAMGDGVPMMPVAVYSNTPTGSAPKPVPSTSRSTPPSFVSCPKYALMADGPLCVSALKAMHQSS